LPAPTATEPAELRHHPAEHAVLEPAAAAVRRLQAAVRQLQLGALGAVPRARCRRARSGARHDRLELLEPRQLDQLDLVRVVDLRPALVGEALIILVLLGVGEPVVQQLLLDVVHLAAREIGDDPDHVRLLGVEDVAGGALDQHGEPQAEQREAEHDLEQGEAAPRGRQSSL